MTLIVACLFLVTPNAASQRKRQRPKPRPEIDLAAGTVEPRPKDEILFSEYYLQRLRRLPGWRVVDGTRKDSKGLSTFAYYDPSRITRKGSNARAWVKYVDKKDATEQAHTLAFEEYDCSGEQSRTLQSIDYDTDGKTSSSEPRAGRWSRIVPDSLEEGLYKVICTGAMDAQEYLMRAADEDFRSARQQEKLGNYKSAREWYESALVYAPNNSKILAALQRMKNK